MKGFLDTPFTRGVSARTWRTIQRLDLSPGMNVLDAGCGPGRLTLPIAENVAPHGEVTAIDIQEGMLREAQERAREANLTNIRFLRIGVGEGKLERNHFDRAVLVTVLGEIPDREAALQDIFEALKPGRHPGGRRNPPGPPFPDPQHSQQTGRCRRVYRKGIFWESFFVYRYP